MTQETAELYKKIYLDYRLGAEVKELAKKYNLSENMVYTIIKYKKFVNPEIDEDLAHIQPIKRKKRNHYDIDIPQEHERYVDIIYLFCNMMIEIYNLSADGATMKELVTKVNYLAPFFDFLAERTENVPESKTRFLKL